jgi:hypothetical protein
LNVGGNLSYKIVYTKSSIDLHRAVSHQLHWSGRGDLNARPPAPKAVFGVPGKRSVFKCLGFKGMRRTCSELWNCEETGGLRIHIFIYSHTPDAQARRRTRLDPANSLTRRGPGRCAVTKCNSSR